MAGIIEGFVAGARDLWAARDDRVELSERTRAYISEVHSTRSVGDEWEALLGQLGVVRSPRE